jgi:hypothetical protein
MFRYDWSRFDAKMGQIFMVGALVVFNLMGRFVGTQIVWLFRITDK